MTSENDNKLTTFYLIITECNEIKMERKKINATQYE